MTKQEALEKAQSAPHPTQELLNELIERTFKERKPKKAAAKKKAAAAPESGAK